MTTVQIEKKFCPKCERTLPASKFYKHVQHSDGLSSACKECKRKYANRYYREVVKHDEEVLERRAEISADWYENNRERSLERSRLRDQMLRREAIEHYGGKCECCGEATYEFLAIDHINGGGGKHREKIGGKIHRWLAKKNYPSGFRVLCHNCNMALGLYGYCPHQQDE